MSKHITNLFTIKPEFISKRIEHVEGKGTVPVEENLEREVLSYCIIWRSFPALGTLSGIKAAQSKT
jgi:hypothetical protein